jgi:hypothetical protein
MTYHNVRDNLYEYGFQHCGFLVVDLEGITIKVLKIAQLHKSCNTNTVLVSKNASTWTLMFLVLVLRIYSCFVASTFQLESLHYFTPFDPL